MKPLSVPNYKAQSPQPLVETNVNAGMYADLDHTADIPNGALAIAANSRVRIDRTERRVGYSLFTPTKPDSNKVMLLAVFKHDDGTRDTLRFTPSSVYRRGASSWTLWTTGTPLTGGDSDHFQAVVVLDNFVFTNGKDRIYKVDPALNSYDPIIAAPKAKFITGFFNRLVAANYNADVDPANNVMIGWSADGDVTTWDPIVDPSAGAGPLVDSPSDLGDPISGVFGGPSLMVVLRELSVWVATKQPSASNPFNFATAIPGIGCNAPHSATVVPGGLCWYDGKTQALWIWSPGSTPEQISYGKVEREIAKSVDDPSALFSSFDGTKFEYALGVPVPTSGIVRLWTYNIKSKGFTYDEHPLLSDVFDIDYGAPVLTIDELIGPIDSLMGTIDSLVNIGTARTIHLIGRTDGDIYQEDANVDTDNSVEYTCVMESKDFDIPGDDSEVARLAINYVCSKPGILTLKYSIDSGVTYITAKSITMSITKKGLLTWNRGIKARQFRWRIESTSGLFSIVRYKVDFYPRGKSLQNV